MRTSPRNLGPSRLLPALAAAGVWFVSNVTRVAILCDRSPPDHPARTAPLTGTYDAETSWRGWIEDEARTWVGFEAVEPPGFTLLWTERQIDGDVVGEPVAFLRDNGSDAVHVDKPISKLSYQGLDIHVDRHEGDVIEGTGPDGTPYRVNQAVPYGYFPGTRGDDGEAYDCYVGPIHDAERVHMVTQCKAATGRYDEQKAMLGARDADHAVEIYKAHTHPAMFGRCGSLTMADFKAQLDEHKAAVSGGSTAPLRVLTEEDRAELTAMGKVAKAANLEDALRDPADGD